MVKPASQAANNVARRANKTIETEIFAPSFMTNLSLLCRFTAGSIPCSVHCQYITGAFRIWLNFFTQISDMGVYRSFITFIGIPKCSVQQLQTAVDPPWAAEEDAQYFKFRGSEYDVFSVRQNLMSIQVYFKIIYLNGVRFYFPTGINPAQNNPDPCRQLPQTEGFGNIAVS